MNDNDLDILEQTLIDAFTAGYQYRKAKEEGRDLDYQQVMSGLYQYLLNKLEEKR